MVKKIKLKIKKKDNKTICVVGVSSKSGVTHLSLSIANFIHSVLRIKVIYVELKKESSLLPVVGIKQTKTLDMVSYSYKGVTFVLTDNPKDVINLMKMKKAWIVIDMESLNQETKTIFTNADNKIILGFLDPWNQREYYKFLETNTMFINGISKIRFSTRSKNKKEKNNLRKFSGMDIVDIPHIENPFSLKEKEFDILKQIIE